MNFRNLMTEHEVNVVLLKYPCLVSPNPTYSTVHTICLYYIFGESQPFIWTVHTICNWAVRLLHHYCNYNTFNLPIMLPTYIRTYISVYNCI